MHSFTNLLIRQGKLFLTMDPLIVVHRHELLQFFLKTIFGHAKRHDRSYFPKQKLKPCPLQWKHGALTKGLPGNFPPIYHSCLSKSLDRNVFRDLSLSSDGYSRWWSRRMCRVTGNLNL